MPLEAGGGNFLCPWSLEIFMPLELGEFYMYAPGVGRILHVCPWSWDSFMPLELGEFYMYALEFGEFMQLDLGEF